MKINNVNTLKYKATLLDREIENSEIVNYDDWLNRRLSPILHEQVFKFSYVTCEFLINEKSDDLAEMMISDLISHSRNAILEFEDFSRKYKGVIETYDKEKIVRGRYALVLKWKCEYSFSDVRIIQFNKVNEIIIENKGNIETPAIITIKSEISNPQIELKGLGEDIAILNIEQGDEIIINGDKGIITRNGINDFKNYESWGFPRLKAGKNKISVNNSSLNIKIEYKSKWI